VAVYELDPLVARSAGGDRRDLDERENTSMMDGFSPAKSWARALELTAPIASQPRRILPRAIDEVAGRALAQPALVCADAILSYSDLSKRSNQYARWALDQGLALGEVIGLVMSSGPEYLACWLGITKIGGVVALVNPNLTGAALAHCVREAAPRAVVVGANNWPQCASAFEGTDPNCDVWIHGGSNGETGRRRIDEAVDRQPCDPLQGAESPAVTIDDRALYIYTSGTTGLPKAASVSHARLMQWSLWFAGIVGVTANDRMYNCLPMYHSVGGVLATGALLVSGGSVVIRDNFSASRFWRDVVETECTLFQYVGELCRYLLCAPQVPEETRHRIRIACGNGLRSEIWERFRKRFAIPRVFEFYASTEGNVSLFNAEGKPGAVGRIPGYLRHRFPSALVRLDLDSELPERGPDGMCVRCATGEIGELIAPLNQNRSNIGGRFEGYTSTEATEQKILRNVFVPGDAWCRTGDLMRMDEQGYFYFVDRIGDAFRWKGENVSSAEVSSVLCEFPGVAQATVYGIAIPGTEGRAGMATIVTNGPIELDVLRRHVNARLPRYARPLFLRFRSEIETTNTFKYAKKALIEVGFDPRLTSDPIYFDAPGADRYIPFDAAAYERICSGSIRV
jgi:fatty-acyl-CoA synthase